MSNVIEKNYVVVETVDYDKFIESGNYYNFYNRDSETDVFNKASRTTVCFRAAYDSKVMYCENCDETHSNQMAIELEMRDYGGSQKEVKVDNNGSLYYLDTAKRPEPYISKVICKKCGSVYNREDIRVIEYSRLDRESSIRLVYDKIYDDNDDLVKFSIKTCSMVVKRAFYSVDNQYKVIFNTKTGQTYLYNNPSNKNKAVRLIDSKLTLENINFSARSLDHIFDLSLVDSENPKEYKLNRVKEIYNLIYEKISNNLGYKPKTLEEYATEFKIVDESEMYRFDVLAMFNRFPNMNPFGIIKLGGGYGTKCPVLNKIRGIKNTSKEPLLELANAYKVKHFDLFKKCFYSGESLKSYFVLYFSKFFDNESYLEKILDNLDGYNYFLYSTHDVDALSKNRYTTENSISLFFKDISKVMDEENLCLLVEKHINSYNVSTKMQALAKLYYIIKKKSNCNVNLNMQDVCNLLHGFINDEDAEEVSDVIQNYMIEKFNNTTYNKNKNKFKFKLNTIDEYKSLAKPEFDKDSVIVSKVYNAIPHFNPYVLSEMLFGYKLTSGLGRQCSELEDFDIKQYIKDDKADIIRELFKEFNIPNVKSLRVKVLKKPKLFKALAFFSHIFTDVNLLNNILDSLQNADNFSTPLSNVKEYLSGEEVDDNSKKYVLEHIHKLSEQLILTQGATIAAKKIAGAYSADNEIYLADIWPMYETHLELYPGEPVDLTGNIREIHDRLVGLTGGAHAPFTEKDFKPFKYSKAEKQLNTDIEGYSFRLAHDGRELAILGNDLKNCVRSYVKRARTKDCYIVGVSYNNEYKICIELTPVDKSRHSDDSLYKYELHQAKLYANKRVSEDEDALRIVLEWMNMNDIEGYSSDLKKSSFKKSIFAEEPQIRQPQLAPAVGGFEFMEFEPIEDDALPF